MTTLPNTLARFFAATPELRGSHAAIREALKTHYHGRKHGNERRWEGVVDAFGALLGTPSGPHVLDQPVVTFNYPSITANPAPEGALCELLLQLKPWRKGPFSIGGEVIDAEWRSDWKWARIASHITPLPGRRLIDVGCGNGYYLFRALGAGAKLVVGVDPTRLFLWQFELLRRALGDAPAFFLPLKGEHLPPIGAFDTAFSMGVLYHRRSPVAHLEEMAGLLRPGGELVLESLVLDVPGDAGLEPRERYAQMRNVWEIASPGRLCRYLQEAGFTDPRVVDVTPTTTAEQHATRFMTFESLANFLDPADPSKTIEGYPAPVRAVVIAARA